MQELTWLVIVYFRKESPGVSVDYYGVFFTDSASQQPCYCVEVIKLFGGVCYK